jgi:sigma-B regulation protein RsbU (phosphoserine phosphatase)
VFTSSQHGTAESPGTRLGGRASPRRELAAALRNATLPTEDDARSTRVLVVDDHAMNAKLLTVSLGRLGYEVDQADSGGAALARLQADPPDVVLLDVVMPDLTGLEVLRRIRLDPEHGDLPVILVSGLGETEDIVEGLKLGANDYVTKPINLPILHARLATQSALKRARDALKRTAALLASELDRQADELRVAGTVQRSILPADPPDTPGLTTAWCYEPASEVGGDLYDVIGLSGGRTFLFLADAMGHGVQAALVASTLKGTLAAYLAGATDLPALMRRLDRAVGDLFEDRFVTAAACVVDPSSRRIRYVLAGHPPILVHDGQGVRELRSGGLPLGTQAGVEFREGETELEPGSGLLLYSDGLTESVCPEGRQLGVKGLTQCLLGLDAAEPRDVIACLRVKLDDFRAPGPLHDDLTILAARLSPE